MSENLESPECPRIKRFLSVKEYRDSCMSKNPGIPECQRIQGFLHVQEDKPTDREIND